MSGAEDNGKLLHRFFDEVLNRRDLAAAKQLVAPSFADHDAMPGQRGGLDGLLATVDSWHEALPDHRYEALLVIPEESKVAARWRMTGTNTGSLFGQQPTGNPVEVTGVDVLSIRDGRVEERWSKWERHLMFQQLGITPPGGG